MDLFRLREEFTRSGIMMCFNGPFSHSIIEEIGTAMRNHLAAENIAKASILDVFAVYIELAQNVKNYISLRQLPQAEAGSAIITIARADDSYAVTSGNVILTEDALPLTQRIDGINALAPDELKRRYREQMRRTVEPSALGAGLGLLEIAKRSSSPLEYSLQEIGTAHRFFSLTAFI